MFWINIKRVIRAGFISFWRNGFVSLASILIMVVTLFFIGSVLFLLATLDASLTDLKDKVDINVYMATTAPESDILALQKSLQALSQVKSVGYLSREDALTNFKKRHESDAPTLEALAEVPVNPLGAVLTVVARDPGHYEIISNFLKSDSALSRSSAGIVRKVTYDDNKTAITRLAKIIASAERLGFAVTVVLGVISVIIAFNTIRLAIYTARDEVSVMRLVGASGKYIRGPFVISGVLYGVIAALITLAAFYPLTYWLGTSTANFFNGVNVYRYYLAHFGEIFGIIMGSGVVLGAVSSWLAVRRYLTI